MAPDTPHGSRPATADDYAAHYHPPATVAGRYEQLALGVVEEMGGRARSYSPYTRAGLYPFLCAVTYDAATKRLRAFDVLLACYLLDLAGGKPPAGFDYVCIDDPAEALADDLNVTPSHLRNSLSRLYAAALFESAPGRVLWRSGGRVFRPLRDRRAGRVVYPTRYLAEPAGLIAAAEQ